MNDLERLGYTTTTVPGVAKLDKPTFLSRTHRSKQKE